MSENSEPGSQAVAVATLAGGCFWCLEAVYDEVRGVIAAKSGYMGGHLPDPTYEQVCTGRTGHAEVVRITFDPSVLSFGDLLDVFFEIHDPTTLNRQGQDVGTQYRSAIFFHTEEQRTAAEEAIARLKAERAFNSPIVTEIVSASVFYPAEWYHDDYFLKNASQPYCQFVLGPKVAKFRKHFASMRKDVPMPQPGG